METHVAQIVEARRLQDEMADHASQLSSGLLLLADTARHEVTEINNTAITIRKDWLAANTRHHVFLPWTDLLVWGWGCSLWIMKKNLAW